MLLNIDKTWVDFNCPKCGYLIEIQLLDIKLENSTFCHNCKAEIKPIDKNANTYVGLERVNDTLKMLNKTFKKLGK